MGSVTENNGSNLYGTSCSECHRRKQRCSRTWPCNHCQSRKVSHLCQYTQKKSAVELDSPKAELQDLKKRKRVETEGDLVSNDSDGSINLSAADALKALGYLRVDTDPRFLGAVSEQKTNNVTSRELQETLRSVPPRPYCDAIVQNYFQNANYQYYAIYPPKFLEDYNVWWEKRTKGQDVCPELTCLVLRILASSAQSFNLALREKIETELGENCQTLTDRYHQAAQKLSDRILHGSGGLTHVQQLWMAAPWFKAESQFIESWHALNSAIRQAQEIGMHDDAQSEGVSEFDREMRRRMWCILYVWDRSMGLMLSRPYLIDEKRCSVALPSVNLERDSAFPDVPSPITQIVLQCQMFLKISDEFLPITQRPLFQSAIAIQKRIETWFSDLPAVFAIHQPDKRFDGKFPYLVRHRLLVHSIGMATILSILKPFLTSRNPTKSPAESQAVQTLRRSAIDYGLTLMKMCRLLFEMFIPDNPKYFYVVFLPFDTAALLCAVLIHDKEQTLPKRTETLEAIGEAISMIREIRPLTKNGTVAWSVLAALLPEMRLNEEEASIVDPDGLILKQKRAMKRHAVEIAAVKGIQQPDTAKEIPGNVSFLTPESSASTSTANSDFDWQFDPSQALESVPLNDIDFGNLEQVWDWGDLNIPLEDLNVPVDDPGNVMLQPQSSLF